MFPGEVVTLTHPEEPVNRSTWQLARALVLAATPTALACADGTTEAAAPTRSPESEQSGASVRWNQRAVALVVARA